MTFSVEEFAARVSFRAGQTLSVEIIEGANMGFTDDVPYEAHAVRDEVVWCCPGRRHR